MPTDVQLKALFSEQITYVMLQPIYLVGIDNRTLNLYILAGVTENLEFQVTPNGERF